MSKNKGLIGAGVGLAALAAAGAYFLRGDKGARAKRKVRGWALKMKGEVLEKMENMRRIDRDTYLDIVDKVAARYAGRDNVSAEELRHMTVELRNAWVHIDKKLK